jgi:hypothetical protein
MQASGVQPSPNLTAAESSEQLNRTFVRIATSEAGFLGPAVRRRTIFRKDDYQDLADVERLILAEALASPVKDNASQFARGFAEELMPITGTQRSEPLRKFFFRKPVTVDHDPNKLRNVPYVFQRI